MNKTNKKDIEEPKEFLEAKEIIQNKYDVNNTWIAKTPWHITFYTSFNNDKYCISVCVHFGAPNSYAISNDRMKFYYVGTIYERFIEELKKICR